MRKRILHTILIVLTTQSVFAQNIERYFEDQQTLPFQKLYIHTDREFYFTGDTIWFASYLLNERTHTPFNENCNLYVDLIKANGELAKHEMYIIENGFCQGWLPFSDTTLNEGNYLIRAYTDYLRNFDDDLFFWKTIRISKIKSSDNLFIPTSAVEEPPEIEVEFFPEGGFILKNTINKIAFKAIDKNGKGVKIKGSITYNSGKTKYAFETDYQGMGVFYIRPENDFEYDIKIENYPTLDAKLPKVKEAGAKLMLLESQKNNYRIQILTNKINTKDIYYIAGMHRAEGNFYLEVKGKNIQNPVWIKSNLLKEGINRLILLDKEFRPLSERMVFKDSKDEVHLELKANKVEFSTRENAIIEIVANRNLPKREFSKLSMVVLDENALNSGGFTQNIKSYLLVDSELKGYIESPADFFRDDKTISSEHKLELLMLTNGWKNYIWKDLDKNIEIRFQPQFGVTVSGKVYNNGYKKKILTNATVNMGIFNDVLPEMFTVNSDYNGNFTFSEILVTDSTKFFFQSRNSKDKLRSHLEINPTNLNPPVVSDNALIQANHFTDIPVSQYRKRYLNEIELKAYYPEKNTRLIEEITVQEKMRKKDDGHYRIYTTEPNHSLKIDHMHAGSLNIFQYINGRFPGVEVRGNHVFMRGLTSSVRHDKAPYQLEALYLLDGFPVDSSAIAMIPMFEVDKIEILKGAKAAIFGSKGTGGVVSVFTKRIDFSSTSAKEIPGTVVQRIKGFAPYREFYSPKYIYKNINSEIPDYRTTLYWNPKINLENGKAEISFFTCDNLARYIVFVEGISESGKICLGETEFEVNKRKN